MACREDRPLATGQHAKILGFNQEMDALRGISFLGNDRERVYMESGAHEDNRAAEQVLKGNL